MTESNSITWSTYEQHKVQIESELRWKIAEVIEQKINAARRDYDSPYLVSGLELAKSIVLDLDNNKSSNLSHPELF